MTKGQRSIGVDLGLGACKKKTYRHSVIVITGTELGGLKAPLASLTTAVICCSQTDLG